ncbi:hypothetical protein PsYK624_056430 [Phanerochaete sordida]|uniref:TPX2 C-terminal domain-containing protein n=1 Tax=Phanerochaete sordida TaxID=48140 RepID=A0A9P3G754_9APHY|nr:hypothetical protein PsYK624_056430 [Phanerochaete sordida]
MDDSDTSFQIPAASSSNLLADDTIGFLDDADMTVATPVATRTRPAKAENPLTLAELTPRSKRSRATPQVTLRRSPRKHRSTAAIPSPLKQNVAADLSAAMEDTLSPFKRPLDQSFQIPTMANATADLLMMQDGESMFGRGEDTTFGEGPALVTPQGAQEPTKPLALSELDSLHNNPQQLSPPRSGSLSDQQEPKAACTPKRVNRYESPRSPSPTPIRTGFATLQETVETFASEGIAEQPRHAQDDIEAAPSSPPPQSVEFEERTSHGLINLPVDKPLGEIVPAERSSPGTLTDITSPAPVDRQAQDAAEDRAPEVLQQPATAVANSAIVKPLKRRSSVATRGGAPKPTKIASARRRARTSSVASCDAPTNVAPPPAGPSSQGLSAVSEMDAVFEPEGPRGGAPSPDMTGLSPSGDMLVDPAVLPSVPAPALQRSQREAESQPLGTFASPADENRDLDCPAVEEELAIEPSAPLSPNGDIAISEPADAALDPVIEQRDNLSVEPVQNDSMDVDSEEQTPAVPALPAVPLSPMRPATKRSASAAQNDLPEEGPKRKRTKVAPSINAARAAGSRTNGRTTQPRAKPRPAVATATSTLAAKRSVRVLRSSRLKNASAASSSLSKSSGSDSKPGLSSSGTSTASHDVGDSSASANAEKPALRTEAANKPPVQRSHLTASSGSSSTLTVPVPFNLHASGSSSVQARPAAGKSVPGAHDAGKQRQAPPPAPAAKSMGRSDGSTQMRKAARMPIPERLTASQPAVAAKLTKPIEFHFHSEARIEARKAGDGSTARRPRDPALAIPDFAALQAQHAEAVAAGRRQAVHPTVPVPLPLHTEARAHDRERFDEGRRAREAALEAQREAARRAQEARDEEEVRELRRRAVPRAHEVPEWYAHAPKRSHDAST